MESLTNKKQERNKKAETVMKKILVVLTGGTIGSMIEDNVINVSEGSPYKLLALYEQQYGAESFEVIQPVNVLSENMTPKVWEKLIHTLGQIDCSKYDGIIVTHGSDTISYTAALLGMLFHYLPIPLILVASNYPLGQEGSNGLFNFAAAVSFIRKKAVRGVFVIYRDDNGVERVYLSTRLREADPCFDQFGDFGKIPFGRMNQGEFVAEKGAYLPSVKQVEQRKDKPCEIPETLDKRILVIRPYPGMDYALFRLDEEEESQRPVAVLHYLYHSATACMSKEAGTYGLLPFINKCRKLGIDFYAASYKHVEGKQYATADALLQAGAIPMLNISPEAAYAKLMLLYHQKEPVTKEKILQDFYFEMISGQNM